MDLQFDPSQIAVVDDAVEQCVSCDVMVINGIRCHELGCPDAWMDYLRKCKWCELEFYPIEESQVVCSRECAESYYF